jgi:hypothetical protein
MAKLAVTPPVVGSVRMEMKRPLLVEASQGRRGLGHLTQRDHPFVHPGAPGTDDDHQRQGLLDGFVHGGAELLADDRPHGAHEEIRLHHAENDAAALDEGLADEHRLFCAGFLLVVLDPLFVRAAILEAQRVVRRQVRENLLKVPSSARCWRRVQAPIRKW